LTGARWTRPGCTLRLVSAHRKEFVVGDPTTDWGPWTAARFPSGESRDGFLRSVEKAGNSGWQVETHPEDGQGALVRWVPGHFLGLNDLAYAHRGRINVDVVVRGVYPFHGLR